MSDAALSPGGRAAESPGAASDAALARVARHLDRVGAGAFALYKRPVLERRLAVRLRARGQPDLAGYAAVLDRDDAERERLVSALAVGVTSFFRNPTAWQAVGALLDGLPARPAFRAWSAGCATGEEAYSIAMLLAGVGRSGCGAELGDWRVVASDLDERSLAVARRGRYRARALADLEAFAPPAGRVEGDDFVVEPEVRARVRFERDDLTAPRRRGPYDLVICRNVLIYFGDEGQRRVLEVLSDALVPGGLLLLGRAELAAFQPTLPLTLVDGRERIYRRGP